MKSIQENQQQQSGSNLINACLNSCRKLKAQIRRTKASLLDEFRRTRNAQEHLLQLALNEAEAMAWQSGFPSLVFPDLALEKVQAVSQWQARQRAIQRDSTTQRRHGMMSSY